MNIVYAVTSYDTNTETVFNVVGWSQDSELAHELESQMNDLAESLFNDSRVGYCTTPAYFCGASTEYQAYGPFDALLNEHFIAITPEGQAEQYYTLQEGTVTHGMNLLKGLDSYLS